MQQCYDTLRNVSLHLPEGYELLVGTLAEKVHLYYDLVHATLIGHANCVKLVLNAPLKTANRYFTLYKVIALTTRISDDNFAQFVPHVMYFGLHKIQRNYILLSDTDVLTVKSSYALRSKSYAVRKL
jgi:hypothetical protein